MRPFCDITVSSAFRAFCGSSEAFPVVQRKQKFATLSGSSEGPLVFSLTVRREFPNLAHSKENF